jgi:hypothetical protein
MASLNDIIANTRFELVDREQSFAKISRGDGNTTHIELMGVSVINDLSLQIAGEPTPLEEGTDYVVDRRGGTIELVTPLEYDQSLIITGTKYRFFTDEELLMLVVQAFNKHTVRTDVAVPLMEDPDDPPNMIVDLDEDIIGISEVEKNLIAILAAIEGLWVLLTDASYEIDVYNPDGVTIPRRQRVQQLMNQIEMLKERYREEAAMLNVGMFRIEMFDLRRVSSTTGRLVPIYKPQEFDDRLLPRRMYPPIDEPATTERPAHLPPYPYDEEMISP